jgi:hypothetical protein
MKTTRFLSILLAALRSLDVSQPAHASELSLVLARTHYTIAEPVEFALADAAGQTLEVRHADGSVVSLAVAKNAGTIALQPGALKPGPYTAVLGDKSVAFSVHPDEHANAYFTAQWVHHGRSIENAIAKGGWMFLNSDYVSLHPRQPGPNDLVEGYIAGSMKPFALMVFGGGHQLDLDLENDWGDPWVQRAIAWRVQLAALSNRIHPMRGLHMYDEPGLTWWPIRDAEGKQVDANPFAIPHQHEEFQKLTGKQIPSGKTAEMLPKLAPIMDDWLAFADLRMKYLEQAWSATRWATDSVAPQFATVNQVSSSYAPHDTTDGVDTRQNRPYAIVSGHGQYSDMPFGTFQPLRGAEGFWGFGWDRPHYYLPMWYTHSWATIRNAVWVSWASKLDGMLYTPEQEFGFENVQNGYPGSMTVFEIAEINRRLAMVGDVMNRLPKTLSPVAVLQSHTQAAWDLATLNHPEVTKLGSPAYASTHREAVSACFFRVLECGLIPNTVDEVEAVENGAAFLTQWKVIFCPALTHATPQFRKALEEYVATGGKLIQAKGDKLVIPGSVVADHTFGNGTEYYLKNIDKNPDLSAKHKASTDLAWRAWNNAGAPRFAAELAEWIGPQPYRSSNPEVFLGVHQAGDARFLLLANNAQSRENPRTIKHELIPAETTLTIPAGGVLYDLFHGGTVKAENGQVRLKLASGDGACLLHLPASPGKMKLAARASKATALDIELAWGKDVPLPFRLRIFDPAGNKVGDYYRAAPFRHSFPLGANASPGKWRVVADEWLTGSQAEASVSIKTDKTASLASLDGDNVSIYFDDARRIHDVFAGKPFEPDWSRLNWDAKRVFGLEPKTFAVFGPDEPAGKIAAALQAKGMNVAINPAYEVVKFQREPNRGGAGPTFREANFENIYAHTIVLPGHPLGTQSFNRGHINRRATTTFPAAGRAYIQWGVSCYQAGWQNVFAFGDTEAAVNWLLGAINGKAPADTTAALRATVAPSPAAKPKLPRKIEVASELHTYDTPVGIGASPDGRISYVALNDGSVAAYDKSGKQLWNTQALLEGCAMAVSPNGSRIAVAGYPGVLVLDAGTGKILDGFRAPPLAVGNPILANRIVSVSWNRAGAKVAAGWVNNQWKGAATDPQPPVILDADGKTLHTLADLKNNVFGVAFLPDGDTLLVGTDKLTAVNAATGAILWTADIADAGAFAVSADGKTLAAGGWGKKVGTVDLADGKLLQSAKVEAVVGGVAFLPGGEVTVAVWGGTKPLFVLRAGADKCEPLFQSRFGFQDVLWSEAHKALVAAEQGGALWLLSPDGKPQALLDEEAGTTVYRVQLDQKRLHLSRMNRVVQSIAIR